MGKVRLNEDEPTFASAVRDKGQTTGMTGTNRYFDFSESKFEFEPNEPDAKLKKLLHIESGPTVDDASVVLKSDARTMR